MSSRSEIVGWLGLRNKREKRERDEMMIAEVRLWMVVTDSVQ